VLDVGLDGITSPTGEDPRGARKPLPRSARCVGQIQRGQQRFEWALESREQLKSILDAMR